MHFCSQINNNYQHVTKHQNYPSKHYWVQNNFLYFNLTTFGALFI